MSCFFCESYYHLSYNCDIFVTDESRQLVANSKRYCNLCLNILDENHNEKLCDRKKRCYQCFSRDHHSAFCQNKVTSLPIPKIDEDLWRRFIHLFNPVESVSLVILSPEILMFLPTQLQGIEELDLSKDFYNVYDKNTTYIAYNKIMVTKSFTSLSMNRYHNSLSSIGSFILNRAKIIVFKDIFIYSSDLFKLLTPYTLELVCINVTLNQKAFLSSILSNSPNLKILDLNYSSSIITQKWPEEMLQIDSLKNFKLLKLTVSSLYFNVVDLAAFMKKTQADVILQVNEFPSSTVSVKSLKEMLKNSFILQESDDHRKSKVPQLTFDFEFYAFVFSLIE